MTSSPWWMVTVGGFHFRAGTGLKSVPPITLMDGLLTVIDGPGISWGALGSKAGCCGWLIAGCCLESGATGSQDDGWYTSMGDTTRDTSPRWRSEGGMGTDTGLTFTVMGVMAVKVAGCGWWMSGLGIPGP